LSKYCSSRSSFGAQVLARGFVPVDFYPPDVSDAHFAARASLAHASRRGPGEWCRAFGFARRLRAASHRAYRAAPTPITASAGMPAAPAPNDLAHMRARYNRAYAAARQADIGTQTLVNRWHAETLLVVEG
jgi:hypothetical protein